MFRLRRWYNQNKKTIWKFIIIIGLLIALLQFFNYMASRKNSLDTLKNNNSNDNSLGLDNTYTDLSLNTDKSVLSNQTISDIQKNTINVVNEFYSYCNKKDLQKAYDMLTEECKEEMYSTIKDFQNIYYRNIFNGSKKKITIENWHGNTYKVSINDDYLANGKYTKDNQIQEYITIEKNEKNEYKLNINGYIGRNKLNKSNELDGIQVNVVSIDTYMDYEIYTFNIKNNRETSILLDSLQNINSMYIEDSNNIKYSAYSHELSLGQMLINPRENREISIKYYSKYGSTKNIKKIEFNNVVLDYKEYQSLKNKEAYKYSKIIIDL